MRLADEQRFVTQIDQIAAQLEIVVQRTRFFGGVQRQDGLVEQLQQHVVQLADAPRHAVEVFHHALDRLVAFTFIAQQLRHVELTIEQQTVVVTRQHQMQRKADAPQEALTFVQFVALGLGEETEADHFVQRGGAEVAARHPQQRVDVAQAAGAAFDIRFQVIAGAMVALVAFLLLVDLGVEKLRRRPKAVAEDVFLHLQEQRDVAADHARFDQVGGHGQIRQPFQQTLFQGAHAVAHLQLEIPQQGDEFADPLRLLFRQPALAEH